MSNAVYLTTERLIIRDPKLTDIDDWHRLLSDNQNMYFLQDIMTATHDESLRNLEDAVNDISNSERTKYFFAITNKDTDEFIGSVGYTVTEVTPVGKLVHMGYFILPEHHGLGYVTEAVIEVLRFAFEDNNVFRVSTGCFSDNIASERVMQKCGFIKEAERKLYQWHDGKMKDRVEYRLLKDEWETGRQVVNIDFWQTLDKLVAESKIVIDRFKDSRHPKYPNFIYPLDYGYLENTTAMDGGGIDIWKGSDGDYIDAVICTVDLLKKDSEIKILIGCNENEKRLALKSHNDSEYMKGILIRRAV